MFYFQIFGFKEEMNRGKPNWEHLDDELHVLVQCEDTPNRAYTKLKAAVEQIKKLLIPSVTYSSFRDNLLHFLNSYIENWHNKWKPNILIILAGRNRWVEAKAANGTCNYQRNISTCQQIPLTFVAYFERMHLDFSNLRLVACALLLIHGVIL